MLMGHLRKAGVQNTRKNQRLKFTRLEAHPGFYINAEGEYEGEDGKTMRVAIFFGPEHGTTNGGMVREAIAEASQGQGFDTLIICGFAFAAEVLEETKQQGELVVLPVKMNPDLAMGDELLKKTGSGNLFMVFGEPDIEIKRTGNNIRVEIHGLDVYDPTTGKVHHDTTDDIACWFIDTNYNGKVFFVRHAYFTGAGKPYESLKKTLRAQIDEEAWEELYKTTSRPFPLPDTGKIAVKVINHYGDEVLKVYEIPSNSERGTRP